MRTCSGSKLRRRRAGIVVPVVVVVVVGVVIVVADGSRLARPIRRTNLVGVARFGQTAHRRHPGRAGHQADRGGRTGVTDATDHRRKRCRRRRRRWRRRQRRQRVAVRRRSGRRRWVGAEIPIEHGYKYRTEPHWHGRHPKALRVQRFDSQAFSEGYILSSSDKIVLIFFRSTKIRSFTEPRNRTEHLWIKIRIHATEQNRIHSRHPKAESSRFRYFIRIVLDAIVILFVSIRIESTIRVAKMKKSGSEWEPIGHLPE